MIDPAEQRDRLAAAIEAALALADDASATDVALHLSAARDALDGRSWSQVRNYSFGDDTPSA